MPGSSVIPMFAENDTRSCRPVSSFANRVKPEPINLTRTSPTHETLMAAAPDEDVSVHQESTRSATKRRRYSDQHKAAIVKWYENGHDEGSIVELFRKEFPGGRKITTSIVGSCLHRWVKKGTVEEIGDPTNSTSKAKPCQGCNSSIENALNKFKRRRDFEIGKLRSFRKLQQRKAKAQRVTWRKKYQTQYHAMRSYADMLKQQKQEVDQQTKSLKKALREAELLKAELINTINLKHSSGEESKFISDYSRIHDTLKTQQLHNFLPPVGIPPGQQYIVIPSSAIQQAAPPSYPEHQSFNPGEYPAVSMPPPVRPAKSQKSRGKPSHIKSGQKRQ